MSTEEDPRFDSTSTRCVDLGSGSRGARTARRAVFAALPSVTIAEKVDIENPDSYVVEENSPPSGSALTSFPSRLSPSPPSRTVPSPPRLPVPPPRSSSWRPPPPSPTVSPSSTSPTAPPPSTRSRSSRRPPRRHRGEGLLRGHLHRGGARRPQQAGRHEGLQDHHRRALRGCLPGHHAVNPRRDVLRRVEDRFVRHSYHRRKLDRAGRIGEERRDPRPGVDSSPRDDDADLTLVFSGRRRHAVDL